MDHRRILPQTTAAAKAGISERSGRRIDRDPTLPSQRKKPRVYRTRANPFEGIWEAEIVPLVQSMPSLQAITILRELQRRHPGRFPDSQLRTLQRHMRRWSALAGPDRDVIFRQEHPPGAQGLSDFTDAGELCTHYGMAATRRAPRSSPHPRPRARIPTASGRARSDRAGAERQGPTSSRTARRHR